MSEDYFERVERAKNFLEKRLPFVPEILLILGTGLSGIGEKVEPELVMSYKEIPHFPVSTVESHAGELVVGHLGGKRVAVFRGRFHYYEGYST